MTLRGPDGKVKETKVIENDITDVGFDLICALMADPAPPGGYGDIVDVLGIGWGAGANTAFNVAQTDLQGASKDRKAASYSHTPGTKDFALQAIWGTDEPIAGTVGIEEVGSFNASSGGVIFSRLVRPILNKLAVDSLEVNYSFTWSQV